MLKPTSVSISCFCVVCALIVFQMTGEKRPSSEMMKPKPKPQKKKKKKDPNEPTKPVSAYALFFRDTQAAIKGQNPNATFGDVSKIVASMWDGLGEEQKQVHKNTHVQLSKYDSKVQCFECLVSPFTYMEFHAVVCSGHMMFSDSFPPHTITIHTHILSW